ncbi:MAG: hypothetical protein WBB22_16560 [Anaerolineae bacterium]
MSSKQNDNGLKGTYEQHWLHARHVADERLWFTNIYVLTVVGLLAFLKVDQPLFLRLGLLLFVLLLSIVGFFVCHSPTVHFITYSRTAELIQINEGGTSYRQFYPKDAKRLTSKIGSLNLAFYCLYVLTSSIFVSLLSSNLRVGVSYSIAAGIVTFIVLLLVWRRYFKKHEDELPKMLEERYKKSDLDV